MKNIPVPIKGAIGQPIKEPIASPKRPIFCGGFSGPFEKRVDTKQFDQFVLKENFCFLWHKIKRKDLYGKP